jgi:hypothetical protein
MYFLDQPFPDLLYQIHAIALKYLLSDRYDVFKMVSDCFISSICQAVTKYDSLIRPVLYRISGIMAGPAARLFVPVRRPVMFKIILLEQAGLSFAPSGEANRLPVGWIHFSDLPMSLFY